MLRDLEKELSSYAAERQRKRTAASGGKASTPKSLWEELYDIGEEFVDFLEQVRAALPCRHAVQVRVLLLVGPGQHTFNGCIGCRARIMQPAGRFACMATARAPARSLSQNLGVSEDEASAYSAFKKEYGNAGGSKTGSADRDSRGAGASSSSRNSGAGGAATSSGRSMADAFGGAGGSRNTSGTSSGSGAQPPPQGKSREQYVEDELAALKRKLGRS